MLVAICIILSVLFVIAIVLLGWQKIQRRIDADIFEQALDKTEIESKETLSFLEAVIGELNNEVGVLEQAISSQLVSRSSEVGSPPPSGAYHTVFMATGEGRVLMIYICLDTGHVARWHFHSPQAIEDEGKRLIEVAQEVRDGTLPDNPEIINISIGSNGMLH